MARKSLFQRRTEKLLPAVETQDATSSFLPRQKQTPVQTIITSRRGVVMAGMASLQRDTERHGSHHSSRTSTSLASRYGTVAGDVAQPGYTSRSPGSRSPAASCSRSPVGSRSPSKHAVSSTCSQSARGSFRSSTSTALPSSSSPHTTPMTARIGSKESSGRVPMSESSHEVHLESLETFESNQALQDTTCSWMNASTILADLEASDQKREHDAQQQRGGSPHEKTSQELDDELWDICAHLSEHMGSPSAIQIDSHDEDWQSIGLPNEAQKTKKSFAEKICEQQGIIPTGCSSGGGSSSSAAKPADHGDQVGDRMANTMARLRAKLQAVNAFNLLTGDLKRDVEIEAEWRTRVEAKNLRERRRSSDS
mmetsp:Transcript_127465/g.318271  ORF Transcript_127465/g.318271 Transcript_127465/m.318271 type:complete len:367 (-) Transcript_127465:7-1107(-)